MSALSGVPVSDVQWLVQSGVEAYMNMPPSALFPVPAEVSAQTFMDASRNYLWRLGFPLISKADARMLLNSARLWAQVNNAEFAALPVVEPVWSAEMDAAETWWCSWCGDKEAPFLRSAKNADKTNAEWSLCDSCVVERAADDGEGSRRIVEGGAAPGTA